MTKLLSIAMHQSIPIPSTYTTFEEIVQEIPGKNYKYLSKLEDVDRQNLESVLGVLRLRLPSSTRILAIGSSVSALDNPLQYDDLDLKIIGACDTIPQLSKRVYLAIRQLDADIEGQPATETISRACYLIRNNLPFWAIINYFTFIPQRGRVIDLLISPQLFERYAKKMEEKNKPYIVLN